VPAPMLATAGPVPVGERWALELKWDGMRALARAAGPDPAQVTLVSRNRRTVTGSFPEIAAALAETVGGRGAVLDGEIVALSRPGPGAPSRPSFDRLQLRMGVVRPATTLVASVPVTFVAFDLLALEDTPLVDRPYAERRALLDGLGLETHPRLRLSPSLEGLDADAAMALAADHGMEGVVAKRRDSVYRSGRSTSWVKTPLWRSTEAVIGGWVEGRGRQTGSLGAVVLGRPVPEGGLSYVGHVGTGFSDATRDRLRDLLAAAPRTESPFTSAVPDQRAVHWTAPVHVAEVRMRNWTDDGHLRHPSWRGLRPDRDPAELA
jgi:bifunctional non-homologous end joining protein LigD